jgi:hypothetical protein
LEAALRRAADEFGAPDVHVTTVTVAGAIGGDNPRFAPAMLAAAYVNLHRQPKEQWQAELLYT